MYHVISKLLAVSVYQAHNYDNVVLKIKIWRFLSLLLLFGFRSCSVWRTWRAPEGSHADADLRGLVVVRLLPPLCSNQSYHVRE